MSSTTLTNPNSTEKITLPNETIYVPEVTKQNRTLYFFFKRWIDLLLAICLLILLAPLMFVIAVLICCDSPGGALFVQERVGSRRRMTAEGQVVWEIYPFKIHKFRTMHSGADQSLYQRHIEAYTSNRISSTNGFKLTNDPRVTSFGRILRKTSLDELPQLVDVLRGDMSLVGPRPVPVHEFLAYKSGHLQRMATLPGMTGLWQVSGRCQLSFERQMQLDIDYVQRQSWWLDASILIRTVPAVVSGRGA